MVRLTEPFFDLDFFQDDTKLQLDKSIFIKQTTPLKTSKVFQSEKEWEGIFSSYFSLIQENEKIKVFYRAIPRSITTDIPKLYTNQFTGILESDDYGETFNRQEYGKIKLKCKLNEEPVDTNLILHGDLSHNFSVFLDPKQNNYKAISRGTTNGQTYINLFSSDDFINWNKLKTIINSTDTFKDFRPYGAYDTLNNVVYDKYRDKYHIFLRYNIAPSVRLIQASTSKNLLDWEPFSKLSFNNKNLYNIYTPSVNMYPNSPYFLAFPNFQKGNDHKSKTLHLCFSRDGQQWNKFNKPWLDKNHNPPQSSTIGIIENNAKLEYSILVENFYKCSLDKYTIPKDRFAYITDIDLETKDDTCILKSKSLILTSMDIEINCQVFETGYLYIELYDNKTDEQLVISDKILMGNYFSKKMDFNNFHLNENIETRMQIHFNKCHIYALYTDRELNYNI